MEENLKNFRLRRAFNCIFKLDLVQQTSSVCVKNIQTQKLETIEKGTLVWMFDETTEFEYFFKFVYSNKIYQAIQDEFEDGVIRGFKLKKQK